MTFTTRVIRIDPRKLKLLDLNARYMRNEVFTRLVDNIRADGKLTQIPFAWALHDDDTQTPILDDDGEPIYEVLSGNHRVKASVAAELALIDVQVTDDYLDPDRRRAIQISHNAISGEDDPATLKVIYNSIADVAMRLYAGLDDKQLDLLTDVQIASLSEPNLELQPISMVFLPHEIEEVHAVWDAAVKMCAGSKAMWLARWAEYDRAMDALEAASMAYGVKNTATAMMLVMEVFTRHITDLAEGYLDGEGEPVDPKRLVTLDTVLGSQNVPASTAAALRRVVQQLITTTAIDPDKPWQVLDILVKDFTES